MSQPNQKSDTRERILRSARHLFNRKGLAEVTIDEIMADAGLTRGGFYKHFESKGDLYAEAISQFTNDGPEVWQRTHIDPRAQGPELARMIISAYLSDEHLADHAGSCPMVGLPSDAARADEPVRAAYRQVLEMMAGAFETTLPHSPQAPRQRALVLVSLCVGSMVLSRAIDDRPLANDLRRAARDHALAMLS